MVIDSLLLTSFEEAAWHGLTNYRISAPITLLEENHALANEIRIFSSLGFKLLGIGRDGRLLFEGPKFNSSRLEVI